MNFNNNIITVILKKEYIINRSINKKYNKNIYQ